MGNHTEDHDSRFDTGKLKQKAAERKQELHEKAEQEVTVRGHKMEKGDIFKFVGLIGFFAIMVLICVLLWPYVHDVFEPGGIDRIINDVRGAGPVGFLILLGLQFLQIVVAFIPGEVVQIAAGMLYGPWIGGLIILTGCVISSAFIFSLVHKLGAPFVQSMVPTQYLDKFRRFELTGKLNIVVFILFLIPGLPKDVFTYLVPLTDMRMRTFLILSNIGAFPESSCLRMRLTAWWTGASWRAPSYSWWPVPSPCWALFCATPSCAFGEALEGQSLAVLLRCAAGVFESAGTGCFAYLKKL